MGKIYSTLTRPVRTFNIANRAERVISREKPIPAPQYASTEKQRKLTEKANPTFFEDHYRKDAQLDQRLKDVFVTSTDPQEQVPEVTEGKLLPQDRRNMGENAFNFYEPLVVPEGKCSIIQILSFISQHKYDPAYSSEKIAAEFKLDKKIVDDILKHFKLYVSVAPEYPEIEEPDPGQDIFDKALKQGKAKYALQEKDK